MASHMASGRLPCQRRSLPVVSPPSPGSPRLVATAGLICAEPWFTILPARFAFGDKWPLSSKQPLMLW